MPQQTSITWDLTPTFKVDEIETLLKQNHSLSPESGSLPEHTIRRWRFGALTIHLYEHRLLLQCVINGFNLSVIQTLQTYRGLTVDDENARKLAALMPVGQNALVCPQCKTPTLEVTGVISGLDAKFETGCHHSIRLEAPIMMHSNRLMPDMNILVGRNLSFFVEKGFFQHLEVVLPDFLLHAIDQFLGSSKAKGASREIESLRNLEAKGVIALLLLPVGDKKYIKPEDFGAQEDDFMLDFARATNSILFTADQNLRQKALLGKRPVVYVSPEIIGKLKALGGAPPPPPPSVTPGT